MLLGETGYRADLLYKLFQQVRENFFVCLSYLNLFYLKNFAEGTAYALL